MDREALGRIVRSAWVAYCIETGDTKESHLVPWEQLSEWDKEADRRIGEAVAKAVLADPDLTVTDMRYVVEQRMYNNSSRKILARYGNRDDAEADARRRYANDDFYIAVYDPRYPEWAIYTISRKG